MNATRMVTAGRLNAGPVMRRNDARRAIRWKNGIEGVGIVVSITPMQPRLAIAEWEDV